MLSRLSLRVWTALGRSLFALALAYAFIVILMTATAQQRVLANLDSGTHDYSSALVQVKQAEALQKEAQEAKAAQRVLVAQLTRRSEATMAARSLEEEAWQAFAPLADRLDDAQRCGPAPVPDHLAVWNHLQQCLRDGALDPRLVEQLKAAANAEPSVPAAYRALQQALLAEQSAEAQVDRVNQELQTTLAALAETQTLQRAFGEMRALRGSWLLGGGAFTELPPTLMQIVMAFFAGAFGALLITLVLAVYPQSSLTFTEDGGGYYARILLGGLISVCVYIMLSGGSAILGDAPSLAGGRTNVMTFSAIGLLAGMFSDRVALWLSERANLFFARSRPTPAPIEPLPDARRRRLAREDEERWTA